MTLSFNHLGLSAIPSAGHHVDRGWLVGLADVVVSRRRVAELHRCKSRRPRSIATGLAVSYVNHCFREVGARADDSRGLAVPAPVYRIWATQRDNRSAVPIEESLSPLTAPAWSPRGKVLAFGRFVPQSIEPAQSVQRGRYEVVIQDGLDRKQVVWSTGEFGLDAAGRGSLPELSCSWSPDGLFLAIPRPGTEPTVEVVRTDNKKHVATLDHALLPVWSPDGSKLRICATGNQFPPRSLPSALHRAARSGFRPAAARRRARAHPRGTILE